MLSKHHDRLFLELSNDVQDEADWVIGQLREFDIPLNISALAIEPTSRVLAIGTSKGAIYIHGGPGVDAVKVSTPASVGVKFIAFASLSQKLLCVDDTDILHIWDLSCLGGPEYMKSTRFDHVTSLLVSPSLQHIFLGLQTGEVKTYDLACLRKSSYTAPNMWKLYLQDVARSGVPSLVSRSPSQPCVDQQLHPRELNKIFVAYSGGVILSDLHERSTIRAYELILPPGAPGGFGYGMDDVLTHRQPEVTCMAIHPSGHILAVGHTDGSISFWAVDDDMKPLTVRTLDEADVHLVNSARLEEELARNQEGKGTILIREPIFKLAWSGFSDSTDPRGGKTTLTVLGGLDTKHGGSLTVMLFPAFHPPDPPTEAGVVEPNTLHPFFRQAMKDSLQIIGTHTFGGEGEIQDFLLCPRDHAHLGGTHDPYAILCLQSTGPRGRVVEAYRFPPRGWISSNADNKLSTEDPTSPLSPSSIKPLPESETEEIDVPFQIINGPASLEFGQLLTLDNHAYDALLERNRSIRKEALQIDGGSAFTDTSKAEEARLTKYTPRRILITSDSLCRVRFYDLSAQLLAGAPSQPLEHHFPETLLGLTVDLTLCVSVLDPGLDSKRDYASIKSFSFAPEAQELAIALDNGIVVVCKPPSDVPAQGVAEDTDLFLLPSSPSTNTALVPHFYVTGSAPIQTCALSDVGFLAVSYSNGNVTIVDLRGPRVLYRTNSRSKNRFSSINHGPGNEPDVATALSWTVTPTEEDPTFRVRLLASRTSGAVEVYTLSCNGGIWQVEEPTTAKGVSNPLERATYVLEAKTGNARGASRSLFSAAVRNEQNNPVPSIFLAVGAKGARTYCNVDGERLGKADWNLRYGTAVAAQVVERMASKALVVITDKQVCLAYTIPSLERITNFKFLSPDHQYLTIDQSGDFLAFRSTGTQNANVVDKLTYGTFFDIRRLRSPPEVDFGIKPCTVPQPLPVSMGPGSRLGSWIAYSKTWSGKQIDDLLGGPDRPILVKAPASQGSSGPTASESAASLAAASATAGANLWTGLTNAVNERGQLLGELGERFNALETGSRSMVAQAKKMAAQQTAKSWFGF